MPRLSNWVENMLGPEFTTFWDDVPTRLKVPATNIREKDDAFVIEVASPGMKKSDFEVNVDNGVLTISYDFEDNIEKEGEHYTHREFGYSSFKRSFTLPDSVDGDQVSAKYSEGILFVHLPKKEEAKKKPARLIDVK
ncbi:Hsp20/alpha crystallin family protein [Membranicola marinus]|uniref:Hsp20/alpha crystallin family protein n=1 Tax=Membranihabitans marinus TaxID=1227546 RepID=A0A953LBB0_9BACT|nr:Hsp20/alpha crystallin family protein [Membranihabitans marinus]MBY5958391.1 Hsp20/alpha crystallin family protein [Membranihabitans marinus]